MSDRRDGIPFEERFCKGKVYAKDPAKLYVGLSDSRWAKTAVVLAAHLPEGKTLDDYAVGDEEAVFLRNRRESNEGEQRIASLRWAERQRNPWLQAPPEVDTFLIVRIYNTLTADRAYAECIGSGFDVGIDRSEVPGALGRVDAVLDVGDTLEIEVLAVDRARLSIEGSVVRAIKRRAEANDAQSQRALHGGIVAREPRGAWRRRYRWPDRREGSIALALRDGYFAEHLSRWLDVFGCEVLSYRNAEGLLAALEAPDRPQRLVLSPSIWPGDLASQQALRARLQRLAVLIWLGQRPLGLGEDLGQVLVLPFTLRDLLLGLGECAPASDTTTPAAAPAAEAPGGSRAEQLAGRYLQDLCDDCDLSAAMWVEQLSEQRFRVHASCGIEPKQSQHATHGLHRSILNDVMREQRLVVSRKTEFAFTPQDSDRVCAVPFRRLRDDAKTPMRHAVVLFHRIRRDEIKPAPVEHYLPGLQAVLEAYELAEENANLGAFALIGKNWSAYLHETRQSAHVLHDAVETMAERAGSGLPLSEEHWRRLRKDAKHLYQVVDNEIDVIRKQQQTRLSVRPLVEHTTHLMLPQFDLAGCAFNVIVPELPLLLALPPIVLDQALRNLLDNALHFASRRGSGGAAVTVRVHLSDGAALAQQVWVDVEDNGPGVRTGDRARLFALRDSGKGRAGTGLGLHFCQTLLRQHGGDLLLVESLRWRRTVFRIALPIVLEGG